VKLPPERDMNKIMPLLVLGYFLPLTLLADRRVNPEFCMVTTNDNRNPSLTMLITQKSNFCPAKRAENE